MPNINIKVAGKIATNTTPGEVIVCGNSDYTVSFDFDEEWGAYPIKTARFVYTRDGKVHYTEIAFSDNVAAVPVLSGITAVYVGVYAGDLRTTTPARILCDRSILCGGGTHEEPTEDVYNQILAVCNELIGVAGNHHTLTNNPHGVTPEQIGAAPAGYGLGNLVNYTVTNDTEIDSTLIAAINSLGGHSFKRIVLSFTTTTNFTNGGGHYYTDIYKLSTNYAIITIKSYIAGGRTMQRIWYDGALKPWEWVNPPLAVGEEYRTTDRIDGKAVYKKKNNSGEILYRLDGESEWKKQNTLFGAAPNGYGFGGDPIVLSDGFLRSEADLTSTLEAIFSTMKSRETKLVRFAGYPDNSDYNWFGFVSKSSENYGSMLVYSSYNSGVLLTKAKVGGTWQPIEWVNPPMVPNEEYRTTKRHNNKVIYTKLVDFGALPNNAEKAVVVMPTNSSLVSAIGYGAGTSYNVLIPGYYGIKSIGSTRSNGALWLSTTIDMSTYNGWITIEYTKG